MLWTRPQVLMHACCLGPIVDSHVLQWSVKAAKDVAVSVALADMDLSRASGEPPCRRSCHSLEHYAAGQTAATSQEPRAGVA